MDTQHLRTLFEQRNINKVKLGGCDIDGVLRGKCISLEKFFSVIDTGLGFCDVIFGWDSSDVLYDHVELTGWHTGYPDALAKPDLLSVRCIPWEPGVAYLILDFYDSPGNPLPVSPRQVLKRVAQRAADLHYSALLAGEYEFFVFEETARSLHEKHFKNITPLSPGMCGYSLLRLGTSSSLITEIVDSMKEYDVEVESFHSETGPGVFEAALKYDTVLRAADKASLFKAGVKELCARRGLIASFMAKWSQTLPGCGCHLHQSLWDKDLKTNLFHDKSSNDMSKLMRHYLAGQLKLMPEFTLMMCPTINSYKRLVPKTWAPTNVCWGIENRTAALRVIPGQLPESKRVEHRLAGADSNPYLAMAASLGAGLFGIEHSLELGEPLHSSAYDSQPEVAPPLPKSLYEATAMFRKSDAARELFGEEFVRHYADTREWESYRFRQAVTDWELERYLEII